MKAAVASQKRRRHQARGSVPGTRQRLGRVRDRRCYGPSEDGAVERWGKPRQHSGVCGQRRLVMTPSSQELESPGNPGRFTEARIDEHTTPGFLRSTDRTAYQIEELVVLCAVTM